MRPTERGASTVLAVAMLGLVMLVGAALGVVAAMVVAHRTAQAAADLGALAGARAAADGSDPCAAAGAVVALNRATLTACQVDGLDVQVTVSAPGPHWLGQRDDLAAQARAGPVSGSAPG